VKENKKFFDNKSCFSVKEVIEYLSSLKREPLFKIGKNLDDYIEAQIHGEINLINDVDCFYIDESFKNTEINGQAEILSEKYDIKLFWIPQRKIHVNNIGNEFRGSAIPILARKIISKFNIETEYINAEIIGRASRDSILNPKEWSDLGTEQELFQYMKQLWHTVAYFG